MRGIHRLTAPLVLLLCAAPASAADADAAQQGRAYFEQASAWITAAPGAVGGTRTAATPHRGVFADLQDVKIVDGRNSHEGHMRVWLQPPKRLRWEMRSTLRAAPTVKILDDQRMWIRKSGSGGGSGSGYQRVHGTPEGAPAVAQLQKDRDRFLVLTRFLTLRGLGGPGVKFEYQGVFERASGHHLAGSWLKVRRIPERGPTMAFLFAYVKAADGTLSATWPAGALLPADAAKGTPTEHYVLKGWRTLKGRRLPAKVERWTLREDGRAFDRTLFAFVADLQIDQELKPDLFRPPPMRQPPAGERPAAQPPAGQPRAGQPRAGEQPRR